MGGACWGGGEGAVVGYCFGDEEGAEEEKEGFGSVWGGGLVFEKKDSGFMGFKAWRRTFRRKSLLCC